MIDEAGYGDAARPSGYGIRTAVMVSLHSGTFAMFGRRTPVYQIRDLGTLLRYGMVVWARSKRTPMDVKKMVDLWIENIVGMCLAHDKDEYDAHDAKSDELLGPLLSAPVKQLREFYGELLARMKEDKRVPMLVWMGFEAWGAYCVKDAPDEGVKRLKNKLAAEIAELVEGPIRDQIPGAIERALRWRDPGALVEVRDKLKGGAKPKLRGRESCLFLEVGRGKNMTQVML